jgi:hypothetical protein
MNGWIIDHVHPQFENIIVHQVQANYYITYIFLELSYFLRTSH